MLPWRRLIAPFETHEPKGGVRRPPHEIERRLRIHFLPRWLDLSDPQAEDAIHDSESVRRFAGVEPGDPRIPDESTIVRFRHPSERPGAHRGDLRGGEGMGERSGLRGPGLAP